MSKSGLPKETTEADQSLAEAQVSVGSNANKQCEMHVDEETRFFCEDCEDFICDECVQSVHKTHDFVSFKNMINKFKETELTHIKLFCKEEKEIASELKNECDKLFDIEIQKIESQAASLTQAINELKEKEIKQIQEVRQKEYITASKVASLFKESFTPTAEQILSLTEKPDKTQSFYRQIITLIVRCKTIFKNMKTNEDQRFDVYSYEANFTPGTIDKTNLKKLFGNLKVKCYAVRQDVR